MKTRPNVALLIAVAMVSAPSLESATGGIPGASTHTVMIENMQFSPAELTVHRGDRVVWVNKDFFPHTVTASDKTFDSGSLGSGGSWSFEATKAGEYAYGCTYHPTMKGKINVR